MSNRHKEVIQIKPTNLGSGIFSFNNGTPQIEFDIPIMPKYMDGTSLRINGKLNVKLANGDPPTNDTGVDTDVAYLDPRTGMSSVIDYLSIANQDGQTYEMIKNYNRLASSLMAKHTGLSDYLEGGANSSYGANGKNKQQGLMAMKESSFSLKLLCGFLNGDDLIDLQLVRGLHITIQLSPDNFVLQNDRWDSVTSLTNNMTYELSDLELTFDAMTPTPAEQNAMIANEKGEWEYNSFSSFYNVLVSNDHTTTLNINTSRTLGITCNMIPSSYLNNYNFNSQMALQTVSPLAAPNASVLKVKVDVNEITFTRGGIRQPLDFEVISETSQQNQTADAQREYVATNSINQLWRASHFIKDLRTQLSLNRTQTQAGRYATTVIGNDGIQSYHFGVSYDHITENGLSFKGTPLGIRLQTNMTQGTPHSIFVFVKHKNTIAFQRGAVRVMN